MLKKIISSLIMPSGMVFIFLFMGLFIWPLRRKRTLARNFFLLAFTIYWTAGSTPVANWLISNLETSIGQETIEPQQPLTTAAVLCAGVSTYSPGRFIQDRLLPNTRVRLLRALQLLKTHKKIKKLIIVGGCADPEANCPITEAELAYMWLQEIGLPDSIQVILEKKSRDTEENIKYLSLIVGQEPVYLVVSAMDIPRVMYLARKYKLNATPIISDYKSVRREKIRLRDLWPTPQNLMKTDLAMHEYIGILWLHLKYWIGKIHSSLPSSHA